MSDICLYSAKCECGNTVNIDVPEDHLCYTAVLKSEYEIDEPNLGGTREITKDGKLVGKLDGGPSKWWANRDECREWLTLNEVWPYFRIVPVYIIDVEGIQTEESPDTVADGSTVRIEPEVSDE